MSSDNLDINLRYNADTNELVSAHRRAGDETDNFRDRLDDASDSADQQSSSITDLATKYGPLAIAIGGAAAATVRFFEAAADEEGLVAKLSAQLRITNEEAQALSDTADQVFRNNFGESIENAAEVLVDAQRRFGDASNEQLGNLAEDALAVKDVFEKDFNETLGASETLMRQFGLNSEEAFDFIVAGQQKGLDANGDFLESITEYSTQFSNAGADAGQFFSVMETGLANGVLGTDKAGDAVKEFGVRILDGSKATAEGLAAIGLDVDQVTAQITSGQTDVIDVFGDVIGRLRDTDDAAVQMQAGVALVGTQFEDLGANAALNIDIAATSMSDLAGATDSLSAVSETSTARMSTAFRQLDGQLRDALTPSFSSLNQIGADALEGLVFVAENAGGAFVVLIDGMLVGWERLKQAGQITASFIEEGFSLVISKTTDALTFLLDKAADSVFYIPGLADTSFELRNMANQMRDAAGAGRDFAAERDEINEGTTEQIAAIKATTQSYIDEKAALDLASTSQVEAIRLSEDVIAAEREKQDVIEQARLALENKVKAEKEVAKAEKARASELKKEAKAEERKTKRLDDYIAKLEEERDTIGLNTEELARYHAEKLTGDKDIQDRIVSLELEIEQREKLQKKEEGAAKASEQAAGKMQDAYNNAFDDINSALGNFFNNWFDGSKSFGDSLKDLAGGVVNSLLSSNGGGGNLIGDLVGGLTSGSGGNILDTVTGIAGGGDFNIMDTISGITGGQIGGRAAMEASAGFVGPGSVSATPNVDIISGILGPDSAIVSGLDTAVDSLDDVFGAGNGVASALGVVNIGMSLLEGDARGAAAGIGSLIGGMTPLGPLGAFIGGQLAGMAADVLGIGAQWETVNSGISRSIEGLEASFSFDQLQQKDNGIFGTDTQFLSEDISDNAELQAAFDALIQPIRDLTAAIGHPDLTNGLQNFRSFTSGIVTDGILESEGFADAEQAGAVFDNRTQVRLIQESFDSMYIPLVDGAKELSELVQNDVEQILHRVNEGAFSRGLGIEFAESLGRHVDFGPGTAAALESVMEAVNNIDIENVDPTQLNSQIAQLVTEAFSVIDAPIPQEGIAGIATAITGEILDAVAFQSGEGDVGRIINEDGGFFATLRREVNRFNVDTPAADIEEFIGQMLGLRDVFDASGISTDNITSKVITSFGGMEAAASKVATFTSLFVTDAAQQEQQMQDMQGTVTDAFDAIVRKGHEIPETREEFAALVQSLDLNARGVREFGNQLLDASPALDAYYSTVEGFTDAATTEADRIAVATETVETAFSTLGLEVPATVEEFAALALELDRTTAEGRAAFLALERIAPEFEQIASSAGDATAALEAERRSSIEPNIPKVATASATRASEQIPQVTDLNTSMQGLFGTINAGSAFTSELNARYTNVNDLQADSAEGLQEWAFQIAQASPEKLTELARSLGAVPGTTLEQFRQDLVRFTTLEQQRLQGLTGDTAAVVNGLEAFQESMRQTATGLEGDPLKLNVLEQAYPGISSVVLQSSEDVEAFANLMATAPAEALQSIADEFDVSTDQLQRDVTTWIGIQQRGVDATTAAREEELTVATNQAKALIAAADIVQSSIDGVQQRIQTDIGSIEAALGRAPSAADNLAGIEEQLANLFVSDNTSIEQSIALREQQRSAVIDVMNEELAAIEEKRRAAEDAHKAELRAFEERQREIEKVIDSAIDARANIADEIGNIQRQVELGGRGPTVDESIVFVQEQLSQNTGEDLPALEQQLALQEQLAELELHRLEEAMDAQGASIAQQEAAIDKLRSAGESLLSTLDSLKLDRSLNFSTNREIFDESRQQFDDLFARAQGGDAEAAQALSGAAKTLLKENKAFNASGDAGIAIQDEVFSKLQDLGVELQETPENVYDSSTVANDSLAAQQAAVNRLGAIDVSMLATQEALQALTEESPPTPAELDRLDNLADDVRESALTQLEGIDASLSVLGNDLAFNLGTDLFDLGASLGLSQAETTAAIRTLGTDVLGPKLDAVLNSQQSSQGEADFRRTYLSLLEDGLSGQSLATAAVNSANFNGLDSAGVGRALGTSQTNVLNITDRFNLPAFGKGGVVTEEIIGRIGEVGPEAIVPLNSDGSIPGSDINNQVLKDILVAIQKQGGTLAQVTDAVSKLEDTEKRIGEASIRTMKRKQKKAVTI